jgi:hypothetical protein
LAMPFPYRKLPETKGDFSTLIFETEEATPPHLT